MYHIKDKKRWWAANFCTPHVKVAENHFDVLVPLGLMALFIAVIGVTFLLAGQHSGGALLAEAPTFALIKNAIDDVGKSFEAYKETNDQRLKALKDGDDSRAKELQAKLDKIEADVQKATEKKNAFEKEMQLLRERTEELEARQSTPSKSPQQKKKDEYYENHEAWIRAKGISPVHEQRMQDMMRNDVTIGSPGGGGYAVPEKIATEIGILERKLSPVRDLIRVVQVGTSDYKELLTLDTATSGWVGESGSRTATGTPQLREITPTHGELYSYPQTSEWALDDLQFNVENWLIESVARDFARQEGVAVLFGNGTNKPTGMLDTAPTADADDASPLRDPAAYQYIECINSPIALDGDCLIEMVYALNSKYRQGSSWIMNSFTTGAVRKLKVDNDTQYLWQPGLQMGQPDRLLGFPVSTWEDMDDIDADTFPIGFGNFKEGYLLVDRTGLRITRDNVTNIGFVRFYVRRREGGIVRNNDAIKFLKMVTS